MCHEIFRAARSTRTSRPGSQSSVRSLRLSMRVICPTTALVLVLLLTSAAFAQKRSTNDDTELLTPISTKTDLYPANADAKKEIAEALKLAVANKKRVLLVFGGNWCYDCHVLDRALHEGAAGKIMNQRFLLVHVDIAEGDKNLDLVKLYKTTLDKGVPAVVILGGDGEVLYSSTEGEFEAARRMMKKDLVAFLNHWKQKSIQNRER